MEMADEAHLYMSAGIILRDSLLVALTVTPLLQQARIGCMLASAF